MKFVHFFTIFYLRALRDPQWLKYKKNPLFNAFPKKNIILGPGQIPKNPWVRVPIKGFQLHRSDLSTHFPKNAWKEVMLQSVQENIFKVLKNKCWNLRKVLGIWRHMPLISVILNLSFFFFFFFNFLAWNSYNFQVIKLEKKNSLMNVYFQNT